MNAFFSGPKPPEHRNAVTAVEPYAHVTPPHASGVLGEGLARVQVVLGSPGTGKTTWLIGAVCREIDAGVPPAEIAYVTYSRAATKEARDRICGQRVLEKRDSQWFRTIHSTALRLLDHSPDRLVTDERWGEFAKLHRYDLSGVEDADADDAVKAAPCRTEDDILRFAHDWGRNMRLSAEETLRRFPTKGLKPSVFRTYVRRYEAFKAEHKLKDFVDLLQDALALGDRPLVQVAFIDEAQDLSPLQIALVEMWFAGCVRIYVAGDDDQAVYVHNGATPDWLRSLAARYPLTRLTASFRLPAVLQSFAARIIRRNRNRVQKDFEPRDPGGDVRFLSMDKAVALLDGEQSTFVLARNRMFLYRVAEGLIEKHVPFVVDGRGGRSPLSDTHLVRAVQAGNRLHGDPEGRVSAADIEAILRYVPSDTPLKPGGVHGRLRSFQSCPRQFTRAEIEEQFGLGALVGAIVSGGPLAPFSKLAPWKRTYIEALLKKYGTLPEVRIILTSIHASKGKETDLVVILGDMTRSTFDEYRNGGQAGFETENRVFYVGVTRARKTLIIVDPGTRRHFDFPRRVFDQIAFDERAAIVECDADAVVRGCAHPPMCAKVEVRDA